MIYFDNAATTYPKPRAVLDAMANAFYKYGANPGRAGHTMSLATSEQVYACRDLAAELFHAPGSEAVVFTLNCTHAVNIALKGALVSTSKQKAHVIVSCLEHNAVMRPIHKLAKQGRISYDIARVDFDNDDETVNNFRKLIRSDTALIVCTHASNVCGFRLPIERIGALAREYSEHNAHKIKFLVDAAQTAGLVPIDMQQCGIDYLCMAGHKSLLGPTGTGMLITSDTKLDTLIEGGTGSESIRLDQPEFLPDRLESGTINVIGIAGLRAGMAYVKRHGQDRLCNGEVRHIQRLYDALSTQENVRLYTPYPKTGRFTPVLSFNLDGVPSEQVAAQLDKAGIAVRGGLQCAPLAHYTLGTGQMGTVRLSPGTYTTSRDVDDVIYAIRKLRNFR